MGKNIISCAQLLSHSQNTILKKKKNRIISVQNYEYFILLHYTVRN